VTNEFTALAAATKLTPEALAVELGVSLSTIARYKAGRTQKMASAVVDKLRALGTQAAAS